jgi:hypothetical protein
MRRKALIIGNSGDKKNPNEYLEGVEKDIKNYKDFLLSPIGGLWNKEEISVSLNETKEQIRKELIALKQNKYDFVFILFSGHGSYSSFKQCRKLYIFDDFIYEEEIRNLSSRQIIILDTCAKIENDLVISTESALLSENYNLTKGYVNFRENYEKAILSMPEQEVILYSSSINEFSTDDSELGGYFAYNLLVSAKENTNNVLSCKEAYLQAKDIVQKKTHNKQNPSCVCIKTSSILPFSIKGN